MVQSVSGSFLRITEEVNESTTTIESKAKGLGIFSVDMYMGIFSTEENARSCNCIKC